MKKIDDNKTKEFVKQQCNFNLTIQYIITSYANNNKQISFTEAYLKALALFNIK